jgi:ribokinase
MLDLIAIGDIKLDTFIALDDSEARHSGDHLAIPSGVKTPVAELVTQVAGSAPNVAIGLKKMGFKTAVISQMGSDDIATQALAFLHEHKIDSSLVEQVKGKVSSAAVVLNLDGESTQLVHFVPQTYRIPKKMPETQFIHISELGSGYEGLFKDALRLSVKGVKISFNPGSVQLRERKPELFDLMGVTEVLFLNLSEALTLINEKHTDILSIMKALHVFGSEKIVVTDGPRGAYAYDGETLSIVPAFPAKRKEATGAGDAFATGFLGARMKGKDLNDALRYASVNSASVITEIGPTAGLLSLKEITDGLKEHPSFQAKTL